MPSYTIEVVTEGGTARFPFTLDDDRALRPQVAQVLEELRQRGVLLKGGRDDELGAYWAGQDLDQSLRPSDLGISPSRPLELRMRPREAMAPAGAVDLSLPRGVLVSLVLGYSAAAVAWLLMGLVTDLTPVLPTYLRLDQATMFGLGALVGAMVLGGAALRARGSVPLALLAGAGLGGAGALIGASVVLLLPGATSVRGFVLARIVGWALASGIASVLLACYAPRRQAAPLVESLALGLLGGALSGIVFALPGPSELWQALAFSAFGASVGLAACGPALWHAPAVVELYRARVNGILAVREWTVPYGGSAPLGSATVACVDGRVALYPAPGGATLAGRPVTEPVYLSGANSVRAGDGSFYVRVLGGTG